jgi:hypothetical protein
VPYFQGIGPLFAFVLAVAAPAPSRAAVLAYTPSINAAFQNVGTRFLSLAVSDYEAQSADLLGAAALEAGTSAEVHLLAYASDDTQEQETDWSNVVRHRGLPKFLLLVFICGAVIRFFTSPTFLTFITDTLDPKAWVGAIKSEDSSETRSR